MSKKETELNYQVGLDDMLLDLKVLLKEYYCGTFTDEGKSLKISLNNGQKFLLNLKAV
ncbi:MAG: hypothetical protein K2N53_05210 [Clostridia bacterium]|nr:hypothetical protein [Clostridia bacterium]MDE7349043.1 hypothetical protein [Clostridia bacterium]